MILRAGITQWREHPTVNRDDRGSIPLRPAQQGLALPIVCTYRQGEISTRGKPQCRPKSIIGLPPQKGKSMTCHNCITRCKKFGKHRNGLQRFRCVQCRKTFTEDHATPLAGMYTPLVRAAKAIELLVEGCSASTVERITDLHHGTILSLLVLVGEKCERLLES